MNQFCLTKTVDSLASVVKRIYLIGDYLTISLQLVKKRSFEKEENSLLRRLKEEKRITKNPIVSTVKQSVVSIEIKLCLNSSNYL
mgnify:CR=1 FL=1